MPAYDLTLFSSPLLFICLIVSYFLSRNKIIVSSTNLLMPWPAFQKIALKNIELVEIKEKNGTKILLLKKSNASAVSFPLDYLSETNKDRLLKTLREKCGAVVVPDALAWEQHSLSEDVSDISRIKYQSLSRLTEFVASIREIQELFWKLWLGVCLIPVALFLPAFPWILQTLIFKNFVARTPEYVEVFYRVLGDFTNFLAHTFSDTTRSYFELMKNPALIVITFILFFILTLFFAAYMMQPNLLKLSSVGLELCYKVFGREIRLALIQWSTIKSFSLRKPDDTTDSTRWNIVIDFITGKSRCLNYSAIASEVDKAKFIKAVTKFAPQATIDCELVQSFSSSNKRSYTELWLQTLSSPPSRKNFVPLSDGALLLDGKYRVQEALGVGGQGIAYLATDLLTNFDSKSSARSVVLKEFVLPVHAESSIRLQALERFNREAEILQRLDHPGVVKISDYFVEDHRGYLVLEHINGKSLRDRTLAGQRLEGANLIQLIEQMCRILGYLTSLTPQIVHRDFTPDNLLVGNDGILKLIDFNVAHDKQGSSTATVVGKHAYLPPEQFRGQPSPRSDIYAMGCTLYFLLTGLDPEPLTQSSFEQATTPAEKILSGIIYKCTALDENERFQTVDEILPLLKQAMKHLQDQALKSESQSVQSISYTTEVTGATLKTDERETICMSTEI